MKKNLFVSFLVATLVACSSAPQSEQSTSASSNAVLDNISARKSVRNYLDKEVEQEKMDLILRAAMAGPSGKDIRPWEFIVINDRAQLDSMANELSNAQMLNQVTQAIVVCGDSAQSFYWYVDCSAAAQNILLAAQSLDLGTVFTAAYPYEDRINVVRRYTNLPDHVLPLCVIPIGYPAEQTKPKDKFNENKIHYNQF